jgi:hypothetical protein
VTVGQSTIDGKCPEMLLRLKAIFGFGRLYEMKYRKLLHHKTIWQFYINGFEGSQTAIAMMWEWLTPEKKDQAERTFKTFHSYRLSHETRKKHHALKVAAPA